jgi:hypothetical protein
MTSADAKFSYGGGHMQKHAVLLGLGGADNAALAAAIGAALGNEIALSYSQPQPAGGVVTSAAEYAKFLRKMIKGQYFMSTKLGQHAVCTNPTTCATALETPIPTTENWLYSLGHWVENDAVVGDGAFSSPGAFGFYPWIDSGKTTYGIVARQGPMGSAMPSVNCGRLIRKAYFTGQAL